LQQPTPATTREQNTIIVRTRMMTTATKMMKITKISSLQAVLTQLLKQAIIAPNIWIPDSKNYLAYSTISRRSLQ
jgi:hypothetical protein